MSTSRPGPLQRVGYLLGRPLPESMRDWVANDITGPRHVWRYFVRGLIPFVPIAVALCFLPASWMVRAGMVLLLAIPLIYFQVALMNIYRRHLLRNNGLDPRLADKVKIIRLSEAEELYRRQHRPSVSSAPYDVPAAAPGVDSPEIEGVVVEPAESAPSHVSPRRS
ncbi:DUF5313 family protein [Gordonia caeni]|uniref:DUF5313 domain-containing protein n=1 Tax=Gordonia caeni TaxID=1007097 RepID=A0ABP7NT00_9ACTN